MTTKKGWPLPLYDPEATLSFGCGVKVEGGSISLYQSFTASASPLARVQLRLRAGGIFPAGGVYTTIRVRWGSPTGDVLGTATTLVPGPQGGGTQLLVDFNFSPPIAVIPRGVYVIEWDSPAEGGGILTWMERTDNSDPGGNAFACTGLAVPENELNFKTFTE